jgi:hypothetical protein
MSGRSSALIRNRVVLGSLLAAFFFSCSSVTCSPPVGAHHVLVSMVQDIRGAVIITGRSLEVLDDGTRIVTYRSRRCERLSPSFMRDIEQTVDSAEFRAAFSALAAKNYGVTSGEEPLLVVSVRGSSAALPWRFADREPITPLLRRLENLILETSEPSADRVVRGGTDR